MIFFSIILTVLCVSKSLAIPILSHDDTKLDSIVISEIDLPTDSSLTVIDQEISREPEISFHELIEKYDEAFIKEDEIAHKKRSSNGEDVDVGVKSIIEKVRINDPDVRMEFEKELSQNQLPENNNNNNEDEAGEGKETTDRAEVATDYDPNYARKIIKPDENSTDENSRLTVHQKEDLQVHLVEQLVHHTDNEDTKFTTIVPDASFGHHEIIKNPEIVDVLEHIVYESDSELKSHEHTTLNPMIEVKIDVDPIEIIPKDRHRLGRDDNSTDADNSDNDKFAGFVGIPPEDLTQPGGETTEPDNFFKKKEEEEEAETVVDTLRETLEYVAIYGKSLDVESSPSPTATTLITTTTTSTTITQATAEIAVVEPEVGKEEAVVTILMNQDKVELEGGKSSSSEEESSQQTSVSNKSSEEDEEKEKKKVKKTSGTHKSNEDVDDDSSEENAGQEIFVDEKVSDLRSLEIPVVTERPSALSEEIYRNAPHHEIKKKDHPPVPVEVSERRLDVVDQPATTEESSFMTTMTALYETIEEIGTTISDGVKLTNELRHNVESFREDSDENKIVLDTHSEAISSKNSKVPLVGVNEMIIARDRLYDRDAEVQRANGTIVAASVLPIIALGSAVTLFAIYKLVKGKAATVAFY